MTRECAPKDNGAEQVFGACGESLKASQEQRRINRYGKHGLNSVDEPLYNRVHVDLSAYRLKTTLLQIDAAEGLQGKTGSQQPARGQRRKNISRPLRWVRTHSLSI